MSKENDILERIRTDRTGLFNKDRLNQAMKKDGLDAVIAVSGVNVVYTSGVHAHAGPGQMLSYVVTSADGKTGMVTDEANAYYSREYSWIEDIRPFRYVVDTKMANEEGIELLSSVLDTLGLLKGKIGIEQTAIPGLYWDKLRKKLPDVEFVDGSGAFEYARLVKTADEIEVFRLAAYYSDKAIHSAWAQSRAGFSEKTVAAMMESNALMLGAEGLDHSHNHTGLHSTVVHALSMDNELLKPGDVVHIDFGAVFGGYRTDISRNAVVHAPNSNQESIYKRMWDIEQKLYEDCKPGTNTGELWDKGMKYFDEAGLVYPWGTLGHSTGLVVHEGFEIAAGADVVLEPGMIINIEPSHIEQGDARYHIEDTILITEDGMELLSNFMTTDEMFVIR